MSATLTVLEPPPFVPREFLGQARAFRNVLAVEDPMVGERSRAIAAACARHW